MGRYSVDLIARRFSKGQPAPSNNAESVQPQRRGSNVPLIHFSQSIIREFEKEDVPNNIISDTIPVPQKAVPISDKVGDSLQIDDPESKKDLEDLGVAPPNRGAQRRWAYKNVVGVSLSFFFIYSSFNSLQNLQSSINSDGGLGLASLSLIYAVFTLAGFIAPTVLKVIGTKYSLLIAFLCHLCYTLANFYPSWYTLVPVSILLGAASALVWAAGSCHLVHIAVMVAPTLDTGQDHLISIYNGLFFFVFQFSQIPGNLASSLILFPYGDGHYNSSVESNYSDTGICKHHTAAGDEFDVNLLYILVFVYLLLVVSGTMFLLVMVNHLGTEAKFMSNTNKWKVFFRDPLTELISVMKDYKMILIAPISIFNGMELSFAFGTFSEAFISRCFGTYQVGFTLIALGLSSGITSMVYGKLVKYVPRLFIFLFGGALDIGLLVFISVWTLQPSYVFIFLFAVLWGAGDGVWNTMTTSLTGILFPNVSGSAYSAQRIYLALGFTIGFIIAEFVSVQGRVWFMLGAVLVALIADIIIEVKTQKFRFLHRVKNIPDSNQKSSDANDTVCTSSDSKNIDEGGQFDAVNAAFRRCSVVTIDVQEVQGKDSFTS